MTAVSETATNGGGATGVRPQDDLFRYVNGEWLATAVIPDDRSVDGSFYRLRDGAEADSRAIVEEAAANADSAAPGSPEKLIGDLYRSFMDTGAVQRRGLEPIRTLLSALDDVNDPRSLLLQVGRLRRAGVSGIFLLDIDTDPDEPDQYVLNLYQGGLGLPDESYYSSPEHAEVRGAYETFLPEILDLAGIEVPTEIARATFALEGDLAAAHWDRVRSRDSSLTYNPKTRAELDELLPAELWDAWLTGLGADQGLLERVIVRQPDFVAALAGLLTPQRLPDWKAWLSWQIIRSAAPFGPDDLVEKNFGFYGRTLSGVPQLRERWKRGVGFVEGAAGEALGRLYVERHFPPTAKQRMDELVANLLEAYRRNINDLPWMSPDTKARALEKLATFNPKIGYPERWRDYSTLEVHADDLVGNAARAAAFELDRQLAKIGTPVDRLEWFMSPQTVNAYYNPGMNEIVFPAAILQPPFFDPEADDAVNYGAIGAIIGHEIGHGFDDQGSKYDGRGALRDWWTADDRDAFDALTRKLIDQYSVLEPLQTPGHQVNGALTVGENIGDLGGLAVAFQAWRISLAGRTPEVIDGQTGEQRFFLSWARGWQSKIRDAELLRRMSIDPHSPEEFRCNQVVRNLTEFHEAFGVQEGDGLWLDPADRVRIW